MKKIQKHQTITEKRYGFIKQLVTLFCILILFIPVIFIIKNERIIKASNALENKMRKEGENEIRFLSGDNLYCLVKALGGKSDGVCILSPTKPKSDIFPQETREKPSFFSRKYPLAATLSNKGKRMINHVKMFIQFESSLLKYRFLERRLFLEENQANSLEQTKLYQRKDSLLFLKGLVLGEKNKETSFYFLFQQAGMLHILVASGFNVSLIASLLEKPLWFLSSKVRYIMLLPGVWAYIWFLGGDAPLLRAGVMLTFLLGVTALGFHLSSKRILLFSGILLIGVFPPLTHSLSFWFSFLATAGLVFLSNNLLPFYATSGEKGPFFLKALEFFREEGRNALAAQLFLFPLLITTFHQIQWHSFLTNTLLLFPIAFFTQAGMVVFGALFFALLFLPALHSVFIHFSSVFFLIYDSLLSFFLWTTKIINQWFFFQQAVLPSENLWFIGCWALFVSVLFLMRQTKHQQKGLFFHEIC